MTSPDPEEPTAGDQPGTPGGGSPAPGSSSHRAQLPADVDAAFAAIVAGWAAEGAPRWPREVTEGPEGLESPDASGSGAAGERTRHDDDGPSSGIGTATPPSGHPTVGDVPTRRPEPPVPPGPRGPAGDLDPPPAAHRPYPTPGPEAEEHFVPPEPPPMPRLGLSSLAGIALLVIGVVLLAVPSLLGGSIAVGIVPGLLAMTAGLGWLVFGLRRPQDRGDGPDDNGVL